jgi:hypothetical protein
MKLFLTFVAIARNRVGRTSGLWVILTFSASIYSVSADTILLKSGETLRGQITSESDLSVTISTETSTGKTDKTIAKTEIVGRTLSSAPASPTPTSVSPDKHWEYKRGEIVNAGTAQVVLDLGQEVDLEGSEPDILWAPDSKRFGFSYSPVHARHTTYDKVAFFQLRDDKWVGLHQPSDALHPSQLLQLPLKDHLPKGFNPRHCAPEWDEVKLRAWTDANTAILYAPCYGHSRDLKTAFLFTLKFDEAGNWKIIKTHQVSKKELEEEQ